MLSDEKKFKFQKISVLKYKKKNDRKNLLFKC